MNMNLIAQRIISTTSQLVHTHQLRQDREAKFHQIFKTDSAVIHHASGKVYTVISKHGFNVLVEDSAGAVKIVDFSQPEGGLKLDLMDAWGLVCSASRAVHPELEIA